MIAWLVLGFRLFQVGSNKYLTVRLVRVQVNCQVFVWPNIYEHFLGFWQSTVVLKFGLCILCLCLYSNAIQIKRLIHIATEMEIHTLLPESKRRPTWQQGLQHWLLVRLNCDCKLTTWPDSWSLKIWSARIDSVLPNLSRRNFISNLVKGSKRQCCQSQCWQC